MGRFFDHGDLRFVVLKLIAEKPSHGYELIKAIETAAEKIGNAADQAAGLAWTHRWKIALAGLLGGLFLARKPITKAAAPLADKARAQAEKARDALRSTGKR